MEHGSWPQEDAGRTALDPVVCYLAECLCFSDTHKFLWNLTRDSALKPHIEQVKRSLPPSRRPRIQCGHETLTGVHGQGRQRALSVRRSKEVRVNTHAASHVYQYSWVRDSGGDAYNRWPATLLAKVEFGKRWTFAMTTRASILACTSGASSATIGGTDITTFPQIAPEFRSGFGRNVPGSRVPDTSTGWYWAVQSNVVNFSRPWRLYHVPSTPSTRRQLDGVFVWVSRHSISTTHWLICAQARVRICYSCVAAACGSTDPSAAPLRVRERNCHGAADRTARAHVAPPPSSYHDRCTRALPFRCSRTY